MERAQGAGVSPRSEYDKIRDKERARERARENRERNRRKREQLASAEHNPETPPYEAGKIAGVPKGTKMDFTQADGNRCNPYYTPRCGACQVVFQIFFGFSLVLRIAQKKRGK